MSLPTCRFCRHVNPAGAKFCNECGSPLHLRPCPTCEAITDAASQTCHQCGASFSDDTSATVSAVTTPTTRVAPHASSLEAPSQPSDAQSTGARASAAEDKHVPEFLADRLEASVASSSSVAHASGRSAGVEVSGSRERAPARHGAVGARPAGVEVSGSRERVAARHDAVGDGEEIIADDARERRRAASDRPAVVEVASAAFVDTDDDAHFVGTRPVVGEPDTRVAARQGMAPPMPRPDAADRVARPRARRHALHPAAWLVVLAALVGYYAYIDRERLLPKVAEVAAFARSALTERSQNEAPAPAGAERDTGRATAGDAAAPVTTTDAAPPARAAEPPAAAAPANDAQARSPGSAPTDANASSPQPAGDAATAQRAAANSHATAERAPAPPGATTRRNAVPAAAPDASSRAAVQKRAGVPKTSETSDVPDVARTPGQSAKPSADALATRRVIERELGAFLPPDAKRAPQD